MLYFLSPVLERSLVPFRVVFSVKIEGTSVSISLVPHGPLSSRLWSFGKVYYVLGGNNEWIRK